MTDLYEYIEAYHNGKLTGKDKRSFEKAMVNDPVLQSAVEQYRELKPVVNNLLEFQIRHELDRIKSRQRQARVLKFLSIAAAVLVLALVGFWWFHDGEVSGEDLFVSYYRAPLAEDVRTTDSTQEWVGETGGDTLGRSQYALAHDLVKRDSIDAALMIFNNLAQNNANHYREKAEWNRILLKVKMRQVEEARHLLSVIQQNPAHEYFNRAQLLARDLDR